MEVKPITDLKYRKVKYRMDVKYITEKLSVEWMLNIKKVKCRMAVNKEFNLNR
jgi:hypothetical protein